MRWSFATICFPDGGLGGLDGFWAAVEFVFERVCFEMEPIPRKCVAADRAGFGYL